MSGSRGVEAAALAGSWSDVPKTSFDIVNSFLAEAPVDLEGMARALGLRVRTDSDLPSDVSGQIMRRQNGGGTAAFEIDVNKAHSPARKRFTLGHEIAHFLLHRNLLGTGIIDDGFYRSGLSDHIETEANKLASELVMPAHLVRTFWRAGIRGIQQLCATFGVSEAALRIRLKQLRLEP